MWHLIYRARAQVGIFLKELGCGLIHGRGNHLWAHSQVIGGLTVYACSSCGKYRHEVLVG